MRLLLSGGGNPEQVIPLDELFVGQIDLKSTVLYIPIAMRKAVYTYEECFEWFKKTYNPFGITKIEMCTDLTAIKDLKPFSAVFIGGGNTFKLLKKIKESSFDKILIDYINNNGFIYGGSSGAIIFGNTIKTAHSDNNIGLTDLSGLNLINGKDIWVHYTDKDDELIRNYDNDLYILYENSGLFFNDGNIISIGKEFINKSDIL